MTRCWVLNKFFSPPTCEYVCVCDGWNRAARLCNSDKQTLVRKWSAGNYEACVMYGILGVQWGKKPLDMIVLAWMGMTSSTPTHGCEVGGFVSHPLIGQL